MTFTRSNLVLPPRKTVITLPNDRLHCAYGTVIRTNSIAPSPNNWTEANAAFCYPFTVWEPTTVYKLGIINGSGTGGTASVGLYNNVGPTKLQSVGISLSAANTALWGDITDTVLEPRTLYWTACMAASVTYAVLGHTSAVGLLGAQRLAGLKKQSSASPLPTTLTLVDLTADTMVPLILLATHAGVA